MKHGKHKMPNGKMMKDSEMKKMMKKNKKMRKQGLASMKKKGEGSY